MLIAGWADARGRVGSFKYIEGYTYQVNALSIVIIDNFSHPWERLNAPKAKLSIGVFLGVSNQSYLGRRQM
jgi:hypothetical protein